MSGTRGFLRNNAFLLAAVSLPLLVAAVFLVASAVPRWTVPLPNHDLLLATDRPYAESPSEFSVDFGVRDGRVVAIVKRAPPNTYPRRAVLLIADHTTLVGREVPAVIPERLDDGEKERVVVVEAFAGVRVSTIGEAPDGYTLRTRYDGGPGLLGGIFGMRSYRQRVSLVNRGRSVPITLPSLDLEPYRAVSFVAWVLP